MVSPELPENQEDQFYLGTMDNYMPDPAEDSDETGIPSEDGFNGYQLLSTDDSFAVPQDSNTRRISPERIQPLDTPSAESSDPHQESISNPSQNGQATTVSLGKELIHEVWNKPRPEELGIDLDSTKTNQILNAMANFRPPNLSLPKWAEDVSEEHWKEELLQRIRHQKDSKQ